MMTRGLSMGARVLAGLLALSTSQAFAQYQDPEPDPGAAIGAAIVGGILGGVVAGAIGGRHHRGPDVKPMMSTGHGAAKHGAPSHAPAGGAAHRRKPQG